MSIKCLMNGLEVNYPCSPVCALFGDCVTAFEAQKKENVLTNADRIRAMNDEELIKLLTGFCAFACIFPYKDCEHGNCEECVKEWLNSQEE